MTPGIYAGLPMREYLSLDALSSTPVHTLIDECPRAGWFKSRLNPDRIREEAEAMDIGTVAHSLLLEDNAESCVVIEPADYPSKTGSIPKGWTNDAIRGARDQARATGKQPILAADFADIEAMVMAARQFIECLAHTEPAIWRAFQPTGGQSEVTMVWDELGQLCKLRTDRSATDWSLVIDYKTSGMSVEPDHWGRSSLPGINGYAFGAAWYRRGIKKLTGVDPAYRFLCQETAPPYLCSLVGLNPAWLAYGAAQVHAGLVLWKQCVRTGQWDGYPNKTCYPDVPPWLLAQWEERQVLNPIVYDPNIDYASQG